MIYLRNGIDLEGNKINILIKKDKIYKISKDEISFSTNTENIEIIDVENKLILPGVIDPHTHMREPGFEFKEDFITASKACAKGGITTFIDMPNTNPTTITYENLMLKKKLAKNKSIVNYGFHFGGSRNDNIDEIKKVLSENEVAAVKIFLNESTGDMLIEDDLILNMIFKNSSLIMVHAEENMIDKAAILAKKYKNKLYVCHVSSKYEMEKIIKYKKESKNEGYEIYAEVTPHHLFLNDEIRESNEYNKKILRMKPELKCVEDNKYLLEALKNGYVDTVGTDHAPHLLSEKNEKVLFGVPGIETSLSLMINMYNKNEISLDIMKNVMSSNVAKIFNVDKRGELKEEYFADIIVVDVTKKWTVTKKDLESKCGWSPFEGWELQGKNYMTIVNGNIVYENDQFSDINKGVDIYE